MSEKQIAAQDRANLGSILEDREVVDLSQPLSPEMAGWRGTERAEISIEEVRMEHAVDGGRISATHISMVAHAGTHLDAGRHFYPNEPSIDQYPVERFVCRGIALDVPLSGGEELTAEHLESIDPGIEKGDAVILHFGFADRYTGSGYYDHPHLGADAADYLVEKEINILGVDTITPDMPAKDRPPRFEYPVHTRLLKNDVLIVENIGPGVKKVVGRWFVFVGPPHRIVKGDASPVVPLAVFPRNGAEQG